MEKQLLAIKQHFLTLLLTEYNFLKINDRLKSWPELSWFEFSMEVYTQGVKLELSEFKDWESLFLNEKEKYLLIKRELLKLENIQELREYLSLS